ETNNMPINVIGRVNSGITLSSENLFIGKVTPGDKQFKNLIVRGSKPFKITSIKNDDEHFEIKKPSGSKQTHVLPVWFKAPSETGRFSQQITFETDQGIECEFTASAYVGDNQEMPTEAKRPQAAKVKLKIGPADSDDESDK